jgi:transcriptional regulator with GAF, ATPase, and Fis domain
MDRTSESTADTQDRASQPGGRAEPGVVLVFGSSGPTMIAARVPKDGLELGRASFGGALDSDDRVSRNHVRVTRSGDAFLVEDAGSRNGTRLGGEALERPSVAAHGAIVRFGRSIIVLVSDVRPFEQPRPIDDGALIVGPTLRAAHAAVKLAAAESPTLLLHGESGSGKELAAKLFHDASGRTGPLVAVNCAAIPAGLAERLLFGAKKGAYSGADDAEGYVQSAHDGTLFLDEVAELDAAVQSKLLRAIETHEALPLGASKPRKVDVRFVFATHRDLRGEAQRGAFRQDLYYRIARPLVVVPALRDRKEDVPWLVARAVTARQRGADSDAELRVHPSLVEACLLRTWPGNVRELVAEVKQAALRAKSAGRDEVTSAELGDDAGRSLTPESARKVDAESPDDARIARTLAGVGGNVTRAAKTLGMHRTQLRRWMEKQKK